LKVRSIGKEYKKEIVVTKQLAVFLGGWYKNLAEEMLEFENKYGS